jgi:SAM-dependent methyltransferase
MPQHDALYDRIGREYATRRRTDPRLAARFWDALGDASSVANVGAGTGSYEPRDRKVIAVEPSAVMIEQRPPDAAPVVRGSAEELPLEDDSVDAAMAILSDHHWRDRQAGLRELARVARNRVIVFAADPAEFERFWLTRDYARGLLDFAQQHYRTSGVWEDELRSLLGGEVTITPVPIPWDCVDAFYGAFWRRPEAYLDPAVRAATSVFGRLPDGGGEAAAERLRADLESGEWRRRNAALVDLEELDVGHRLIVARY